MSRLRPGDTLGTCEIEAFVAEGGMATVYRARQTLMKRIVAVKVLHPKFLGSHQALAGFLTEGMAGARLTHPSIAQVFYTAEENGIYYIVMDFVDGEDLRTMLRNRGPFPVRKVLEVARQVAEVLAFSHDRGIVHRDIKPGNIMMSPSGRIILTDFGIASLLTERCSSKKEYACGTPAYMSPEQFRGEVADGRSDLYSLGATLYALLTGAPPFKGSAERPLAHRVLRDRPRPLRDVLPDIPKRTASLVERLLSKDPDARYQTARDVVRVLDEALNERTGLMPKIPRLSREYVWRKSFWWPALISVAALWIFGLSLFLAMSWASPSFDPPDDDHPAAGPGGTDSGPGDTDGPPDGSPSPPAASLEERLEKLRKFLTAGRMQETLEMVLPRERGKPKLLSSLVSLFQELKSLPPISTANYSILSRASTRANVLVLVGAPDEGKVLRIPLTWIRDKRGNWYILPDTRAGTIRFRF